MDRRGDVLVLLISMCIAVTTVLLTVGQHSDQRGDDYLSADCKWTEQRNIEYSDFEPANTEGSTPRRYVVLSRTDAMAYHLTCGNDLSDGDVKWYKAEGFGNITKSKRTECKNSLSFSSDLHPTAQGGYFCSTDGSHESADLNANRTFAVVRIQEVDTYLIKMNFSKHPISEGTGRHPECNEEYVGCKLCGDVLLAGTCCLYVQRVLSKPEGHAEGYLYLEGFQNVSKLEVRSSLPNVFKCRRGLDKVVEFNIRSLQPISFCERIKHGSVGNLTFQKTNINMTANSTEIRTDCKPPVPMASMLCSGDFIKPALWENPILNNCTDDGSTSSLPIAKVGTMNPVTASIKATTRSIKKFNYSPVTVGNVNEISRKLSEDTKNPGSVDASHLMKISKILQNISKVGDSSDTVTRHVMAIVNNLLNVTEDVYKDSISRGGPSRILRALEAQLTNVHKRNKSFTDVRSSLGVAARQFEGPSFSYNITFGGLFSFWMEEVTNYVNQSQVSVMAGTDNVFSKFPATITLPANLLDKISTGQNDRIPVTFIIHRTSLLFISSASQERRQSERIESLVIAATVEGQTIANLSSPVISRFLLPHVEEPMSKSSRKCVFWDFNLAKGLGDWSSQGCELVSISEDSTGSIVECHCNHLTNFAVLLDIQGDINHFALDILSTIGCVVSIFALVITLIVLLTVKKLREQVPQKIIINLCFALLGLYICFLVGIGQSSLGTGCVIFGALIHYFCLASVAWMCVVATNMYLLFVRVFNADVTGFMWKAILAAWCLPMIVVVVSVILRHQHYTSSYCFPQPGTLIFYLGVLLLIGLMLGYNIVIFILIIRQVTCGRIGKPAGQDKRTEIVERAQSIVIISVLLGMTWVFGFLSIGGARFIFNLLFLVFNSLQGFFVFVFFILRPTNVPMLLFKCCYGQQEDNVGRYTVNKSKIDETNDQEDTLDMNDVVVTTTEA